MKIMVVDDEEDIKALFLQKFRREIKKGEIDFFFVFSAEEALAKLEHEDPNCLILILADINMPGMNGLELLKIIKQKYSHLQVFMITAYGDEKTYKLALENGADAYIDKPLDFKVLKQKINQLS